MHVREVTLGVPESSLIPELRHRLMQSDLRTRFGPGEPLSHSPTAVLLALISQHMDQRSYATMAALVRHPAVESMLSENRQQIPKDWLSQLDNYYENALPSQLDGFVNEELRTPLVFRAVTETIARWLKPLDKQRDYVSLGGAHSNGLVRCFESRETSAAASRLDR